MDDIAISIRTISKRYNIYQKPIHRLMEYLSFGARTYHQAFWALTDISFDVLRGEAVE
jgi:lipopolysaccharide transport system ATP-binding protein